MSAAHDRARLQLTLLRSALAELTVDGPHDSVLGLWEVDAALHTLADVVDGHEALVAAR